MLHRHVFLSLGEAFDTLFPVSGIKSRDEGTESEGSLTQT